MSCVFRAHNTFTPNAWEHDELGDSSERAELKNTGEVGEKPARQYLILIFNNYHF